jgi:hypothetical protein
MKNDIIKIGVFDGQGGGLGKSIVEKLKKNFGQDIEVFAVGTNSIATSNMLKAGADFGSTGENSFKVISKRVDMITGPIGLLIQDSLLGEITPKMSEYIETSKAKKILFPISRCNVKILCSEIDSITTMLNLLIHEVNMLLEEKNEK